MKIGLQFPMTVEMVAENFLQLALLQKLAEKIGEIEEKVGTGVLTVEQAVAEVMGEKPPPPKPVVLEALTPATPQAAPWPRPGPVARTPTLDGRKGGLIVFDICKAEVLQKTGKSDCTNREVGEYMFGKSAAPSMLSILASNFRNVARVASSRIIEICEQTGIPLETFMEALGPDLLRDDPPPTGFQTALANRVDEIATSQRPN